MGSLGSERIVSLGLSPEGPNRIGFSPNPFGTIKATEKSPDLTAASAVAAVYGAPGPPLLSRPSTTFNPSSAFNPATKRRAVSLRSSSTTATGTLRVVARVELPAKIVAKTEKKTIGTTKERTSAA